MFFSVVATNASPRDLPLAGSRTAQVMVIGERKLLKLSSPKEAGKPNIRKIVGDEGGGGTSTCVLRLCVGGCGDCKTDEYVFFVVVTGRQGSPDSSWGSWLGIGDATCCVVGCVGLKVRRACMKVVLESDIMVEGGGLCSTFSSSFSCSGLFPTSSFSSSSLSSAFSSSCSTSSALENSFLS